MVESSSELVKRPLGKCTAIQLGQYLVYLMMKQEESAGAEEGEEDYSTMTVLQLKDLLRRKGLKVSGKKAELIERLRSF